MVRVVSYAGIPSSVSKKSPLEKKPCSQIINKEAPICEPVNENHPVVVELLSANYTLKESIDAVESRERFGHDLTLDTDRTLESALKYLDQMTAEEDGEEELLPSTQRHLSHEDSQTLDDFNTEWLDLWLKLLLLSIVIIISVIIRESGDPPSIFSDCKVEDMYLKLEQLGNVLKTLSGSLQGMF